jgi:hypothetical protein
MKIYRRNLLLASSALALVMLFGCSSSEESSDTSGESSDGSSNCEQFDNAEAKAECERAEEMRN